ncbi:DUF2252 domain-containing protein [Bradyrhizobium sp. CIAT3101]|uniref:DUF2252 domain-containing protein n=1 Tax=Bradyrhizobium sp. CIAT3101 TaxID=439387 RepID=UPI0024B0F4CB|nr:DUF2252 domain-containing protein [Bradyrhizobium sp. CIAT3101]WFU79803.1 DUF2252 domain-containing protein [Bradyrhizobium sp. CIAT3101]
MKAGDLQPPSTFYRMTEAHGEQALIDSFLLKQPSVSERMSAGKALRKQVPRSTQAVYETRASRPDPIDILRRQDASRVKDLLPIRYGRMLEDPFAFFRGGAAIMASDLAPIPISGTSVMACGDAHVKNFGVYASAERSLIFAINDYDETFVGPWEWDLKRLAASAVVATRCLGGDRPGCEQAVRECVQVYRERIFQYAQMSFLEVWYDRIDERAVLDSLTPKLRRIALDIIDNVRHIRPLEKLTEESNGTHRFIEHIPLIERVTRSGSGTSAKVFLDRLLQTYIDSMTYERRLLLSRYRLVDYARKVVGIGSVGTRCWVLLLQGVDDDDPLFLQIKEAQPSVLASHIGIKLPFDHQGRRVVVGQRLTQGSPDIFLGWGQSDGRDFYVRQLSELKGSAALEDLEALPDYCGMCGWALALAHAKSGDAATIAGYCGRSEALDEAIAKFALSYAKQTEQDHEAFAKSARSGRIRATSASA